MLVCVPCFFRLLISLHRYKAFIASLQCKNKNFFSSKLMHSDEEDAAEDIYIIVMDEKEDEDKIKIALMHVYVRLANSPPSRAFEV